MYRQCELLDVSRTAHYYRPAGEDEFNLKLMRAIDEYYTRTPFYGVERMTAWLKLQGHIVNPKRIRRLMRLMGIEAIYPKASLSNAIKSHKKYPYLLKGVSVRGSNQVWCADITYIRLSQGFIYLFAIMDWFSRYVLSWSVSTMMEREFCIKALKKALADSKPEIFNTDQGSQFTSLEWVNVLEENGIKISMDGQGRVFDNIFIERLWRTVKYEEVYLKSYETVNEARDQLNRYFHFYNTERLHSSLDYNTPVTIHKNRIKLQMRQANKIHHKQANFLY